MAKRPKMQLLRPLADVRAASGLLPDGRTSGNGATRTADAPQVDASSRAEERAGGSPEQQQRMKEQSDAELAGLRSAQAALEDASSKLRQLQDRFLAEAEEQLLTLSIDIAEKVLMQAIEAGRYEIDPIVKEALSKIPTNADVVVRLHPDDLDRSEVAVLRAERARSHRQDPGQESQEADSKRLHASLLASSCASRHGSPPGRESVCHQR